jgi:hypothetical protein
MLSRQSAVRKVLEGLAVTLSLPIGCGARPATRPFETAQPIVATADSSIDTSMKRPATRSRSASAAPTAIAAVSPARVSATGQPTRYGAVSGAPARLVNPDLPCTIWS